MLESWSDSFIGKKPVNFLPVSSSTVANFPDSCPGLSLSLPRTCFYQTESTWPMDQASTTKAPLFTISLPELQHFVTCWREKPSHMTQMFVTVGAKVCTVICMNFYTPAQRSWRGGILDSPCPSVRPSVRPSVCRWHGFRSISQVCFGISISNFICMLMVAIGRSLLIFSVVSFKMAAWWPYWIFWFPDSNFNLALNINSKLKWHNTYVYV